MKNRLIELLKDFRTPICEGLNAKLPDVEGLADYLLANGVIVTPCVVYNKKHERYQIIKVGKQLHRFSSKFYRTKGEAEKALKGE